MLRPAPCIAVLSLAALQARPGARIDAQTLMREARERTEQARFPDPPYALEHNSRVLRWEEREGRREALLAETHGPGAFVRLSISNASGRVRLYLGQENRPALVAEAAELASLALPFAKGARLTLECASEPRFELVWRAYAEGTPVADWAAPASAAPEPEPAEPQGQLAYTLSLAQKNPSGDFLAVDPALCQGPRAVSELVLRVEGPDPVLALRGLVLHIRFDGEETVVCPASTFFASTESEPRVAAAWTRDFAARWLMPYRERVELSIENLGPASTHVAGSVYTQPWAWDERSLHFGARWIAARGPTRLSIEGRGVLLGILAGAGPSRSAGLAAGLDSRPLPLRAALAGLDRAPFRERLVFELPEHEAPEPQRVAFFYLRPGAKIASRDPRPPDRESLAADR